MINDAASLENIAHVIQVALTPVFLLSVIAALLNVFSTRLGRVSDRVHILSRELENYEEPRPVLERQLAKLRRRSFVLDLAVVMASLAGVSTCIATLALFLGVVRAAHTEPILLIFFGVAVVFTLCALFTFMVEMLLASQGMRARAKHAEDGS